ncbi:MAG: NAD(P)/FAD-dependent oxidoreductase, partial [Bryobacteraceae bacterium]
MMCALTAAQRGRSVLLVEHSAKLAEKIRISGGGRCNFTNFNTAPDNFISSNPHFCRSALARFTPQQFIELMQKHGLAFHEKKLGQLFCDDGSASIIAMLKNECDAAGVRWCMPCDVHEIGQDGDSILTLAGAESGERGRSAQSAPRFIISTARGQFQTRSLVIASGGLSIPKIGATPFGYKAAQQFGIPVTKLKPGLVPLSFDPQEWKPYAALA